MKRICRACSGGNLFEMIDLGNLPIAHRLLSRPDEEEKKYPFALHCCADCGLIQICDPIDPALLYFDYNYCFSSWKPEPHIEDEAQVIFSQIPVNSALEIGCNDGKFLELLKIKGALTLSGIEPNRVAGRQAKAKGFNLYPELFNGKLCDKIVKGTGKFDLVVARQVLEHILDIKDFFGCVDALLDDKGHLFIDLPDFQASLSMGDCSMLWEEHVSYFTEPVIRNTLLRFGFEPVFVKKYDFSGGTIAILAKRSRPVKNGRSAEGLVENARLFSEKARRYAKTLHERLSQYRSKKHKIILYGVGCRACTVVNYLELGEYIDFAVDDQPQRQNKYMPGSRLKIMPSQAIKELGGSVLCLLAVNQENENSVKRNLNNGAEQKIDFISLFSPETILIQRSKQNADTR